MALSEKHGFLSFILLLASTNIVISIDIGQEYSNSGDNVIINHINVIPMYENGVLPNKTVVIRGETIIDIRDEPMTGFSPGATIVDGTGLYLMPGLVDMHVHINNAKDLDLFVANGVTAVQNMWGYEGLLNLFGFSNQLRLKTQIDSGKRLGPSIYTAGPILEGHPKTQPFMTETTDPRAAVRLVRSHREKGYDFVKVYDHLHEGVYLSIMEECRRLRMPVKGHVPYGVGILQALQWGQRQIDHLTGYLDYDMVKLLLPEEQLAEYARLTREYEVYNCPTVVFTQKRVGMAKFHEMSKHPAMKHLNFMQKLFLRKSVASLEEELRYQGQDYQRDVFELYKTVIHALQQENAPILAGTDTGNPFVFPGYALHEELELLVRAGMSPYEALSCATVRPYESLGMIDKAGTIEVGKRADLIILRKNPLDDISGITQIEGVILKGKLLSRDCLNELLN